MAWNEPGGDKKDPWGQRNNQDGPPDIDEVVRKMRDKFGGLFGGKSGGGTGKSSGGGFSGIIAIIVIALVLIALYNSVYVIQPAERGVVMRLGKYAGTLQPGFNLQFPPPIDRVLRVNVDEVRAVTVGNTKAESLMLTQDENIIDIKFTVQYRINNAKDYMFYDRNPDMSLRQATETAVREIVGKSKMDFVITDGRDVVAQKAKELVQEILDNYRTGLEVVEFNMQDAQPPEEVQAAFADVVNAREDEQRYKNEADAYARDVLGKAQGAAQRTLLDASGYKSRVVESASGEASRFEDLLTQYQKAPEVTRERLYLDTMQDVLSTTSKIVVDTKGGNNVLYLPLDKLIGKSSSKLSDDSWSPQYVEKAPPSSAVKSSTSTSRTAGGR
jgi:membrane protease subunit HflK